MIICDKCFMDEEISSSIRNLSNKGVCPTCGSTSAYLYDTDINDELVPLFDDLISIYTPINLLPENFPKSETKLLKTELCTSWNIFKAKNDDLIYKIITSICQDKYINNPELFDYPIGLADLYENHELENHALLKSRTWEDFTDSLKTKNRFHSHHINLVLFEKFCTFIRKPYKRGSVFFRSRLGDENGFEKDMMSAPPSSLTIDGRANSRGVRCLYLGDAIETTIHETRASEYDYITVGKFVLKEDIIVIDLKRINRISPFIDELDTREYALNKETLNKINFELGKTLRRSDSYLDYIPTQYISDFVRSIQYQGKAEYAGIEYNSVMYNDGYNLAIFNPDLFECVETTTFKIESVIYNKKRVL